MPSFGQTSQNRLERVHPYIRNILDDVVAIYDITIPPNGGLRTIKQQEGMVSLKKSKTMNSKHLMQNNGYSHAVDCLPYPVDFNDRDRFYYMIGLIRMAAENRGVKIRQGHDWDGDSDFKDQSFDDLGHFEITL